MKIALATVSVLCLFFTVMTFTLWQRTRQSNTEIVRLQDEAQVKPHQLLENFKTQKQATSAPTTKKYFPPASANLTKFTAKLLLEFPERVNRSYGYIDGYFFQIDGSAVSYHIGSIYAVGDDGLTAFVIDDKNGDLYSYCLVKKSEFGDQLLKLKMNDKIRVTGQAISMASDVMWIRVSSIDVVK